jgi:hypothetical protein
MRRATCAAVLVGALTLAPLAAAGAEPAELESDHVTDRAGVLTATEERRLEDRLAALAEKDDRPELYVVFVDDFEDPSNALQWADRTAQLNNLAPDQYLLAVATEGRAVAISAEYEEDGGGPLSEERVLEIEDGVGSGYFADEDWAGGVDYAAAEFDEVPPPWWVWALGLAGLALVVFLIVQFVLLGRRKAARALELRTLEGQKKRASITLVRTDEALRTSEQELGFVTAEFGEEATAEFSAVLSEGRAKLDRAFELQRQLEDATEDSDADTRSWTDEILALCGQVDRALNERTRKLAELRGLAKDAATTLERLTKARTDADSLVAAAEAKLAGLGTRVPSERLTAIADDPQQMRDQLEHADQWLARLHEAAASRKATAISTAVHEVERDLAEVAELHAAVTAFAASVAVDAPAIGSGGQAAASPAPAPSTRDIDRADAAVRAAEASVAARPGQLTVEGLSTLRSAREELALGWKAAGDPAAQAEHARSALALAQQVQRLAGEARSYAASGTPSRPRPSIRSYATDPDESGTGMKAGIGALSGGAAGFFAGLGVLGDEDGSGAGLVVLFILGGAVVGALSGAFGGDGDGGGGSSSGWGGSSSRSSWSSRSSSRSSFSGGSSRSSSSSRSSGRSGGRRF